MFLLLFLLIESSYLDRVTALEAEDTNKDDAMYNLLKSLTEETTDLTTFLKNYRQLARDQFMARAKLIQARQGKLSNHS
jgi:hypothetical protein